MKIDLYGQVILSEDDLCNLYLEDENANFRYAITEKEIHFNPDLEIEKIPKLIHNTIDKISIGKFDEKNQEKWFMPDEYKNMDIAKFVLDLCKTDYEKQRVGEELLLFLDRNLFPLLQYLKYLVDQMRKYNIVWGVGRGSSVSSYVLFLIGIHKIDSIYYDLDINEFLR